jgi:hypothetical protein
MAATAARIATPVLLLRRRDICGRWCCCARSDDPVAAIALVVLALSATVHAITLSAQLADSMLRDLRLQIVKASNISVGANIVQSG